MCIIVVVMPVTLDGTGLESYAKGFASLLLVAVVFSFLLFLFRTVVRFTAKS